MSCRFYRSSDLFYHYAIFDLKIFSLLPKTEGVECVQLLCFIIASGQLVPAASAAFSLRASRETANVVSVSRFMAKLCVNHSESAGLVTPSLFLVAT